MYIEDGRGPSQSDGFGLVKAKSILVVFVFVLFILCVHIWSAD